MSRYRPYLQARQYSRLYSVLSQVCIRGLIHQFHGFRVIRQLAASRLLNKVQTNRPGSRRRRACPLAQTRPFRPLNQTRLSCPQM
jgi:hypothetical protein